VAYEITDHLGNVRALLRDHVNTYTATMEDSGEADASNPRVEEQSYFSNIGETVVTDPRMNYTAADPGNGIETPSKASYLFWQDGMAGMEATDKSVGPAIGLKVNAAIRSISKPGYGMSKRRCIPTHDAGRLVTGARLRICLPGRF
jgi:hypothetical protein